MQVRVVCNSTGSQNDSQGNVITTSNQWKTERPPAYDAIYPQGPPDEISNVPRQIHSPQFAHATATSSSVAVVSTRSMVPQHRSVENIEMQAFPQHNHHRSATQLREPGDTNTGTPTTLFHHHPNTTPIIGYSQSLDRRVPFRRLPGEEPCCHIASEHLPCSPPSYDYQNYTTLNHRLFNSRVNPRQQHTTQVRMPSDPSLTSVSEISALTHTVPTIDETAELLDEACATSSIEALPFDNLLPSETSTTPIAEALPSDRSLLSNDTDDTHTIAENPIACNSFKDEDQKPAGSKDNETNDKVSPSDETDKSLTCKLDEKLDEN